MDWHINTEEKIVAEVYTLTTTYEPNKVLATGKYDVIGTRPIRHDGADKVTGRAKDRKSVV